MNGFQQIVTNIKNAISYPGMKNNPEFFASDGEYDRWAEYANEVQGAAYHAGKSNPNWRNDVVFEFLREIIIDHHKDVQETEQAIDDWEREENHSELYPWFCADYCHQELTEAIMEEWHKQGITHPKLHPYISEAKLRATQAICRAVLEEIEEIETKNVVEVEYDPSYWGGDYSDVGETVHLIPMVLDTTGMIETVEDCFERVTGYNRANIVHYSQEN